MHNGPHNTKALAGFLLLFPLQFTRIISGFVTIWTRFQTRARNIIEKLNPNIREHIIWTNSLTKADVITDAIPTDYTVQIWTDSKVSFFNFYITCVNLKIFPKK